ncbi:hypothetical protein Y032_0520g2850 [Ancylostoma ceylanicum]|uniref:Uncharacterized protein n=1 Tax=Ancylostoma ceylanicum TaxID=53326 RepID=A0A016WUN0_9BILA|nr:hypothetical protein Y032_0520g2850 [Ancylostoma ceylanicum]
MLPLVIEQSENITKLGRTAPRNSTPLAPVNNTGQHTEHLDINIFFPDRNSNDLRTVSDLIFQAGDIKESWKLCHGARCIGIAYVLGMTMMFFGITALVACLTFRVTFLYTVYAAIGALLSMLYLAIDIQLIMGGRQFELSPEEYIFAAMQIFLDILNIFLFILQIFGKN